ncbi:transient receptor potential cation channel subfamily A member 1-like [Sycon ciliatum]|uniref:transient receptor potential cation channel subfamily A member 1-like n=1 Tax=Sycon ciliatum TaxID=27933 RepID=UPI0020AA544D|eukprot:scpid14393/ scgid11496/ Transient receptor potential cation channel subfamily A member 1 homolog
MSRRERGAEERERKSKPKVKSEFVRFEVDRDDSDSPTGLGGIGRRLSTSFGKGRERAFVAASGEDGEYAMMRDGSRRLGKMLTSPASSHGGADSGTAGRSGGGGGTGTELQTIGDPMVAIAGPRTTLPPGARGDSSSVKRRTNPLMRSIVHKHSQASLFVNQMYAARLALRNAVDTGSDPLHQAARDGMVMELTHILDTSPMNTTNSLDGNSYAPLHYAARGNHIECVKMLLDNGADANIQGDEERTPLFLAAKCNRPDVVGILCQHPGARTDLPDMYGMLPSHVAARRGHSAVLKELNKSGALHIESPDFHGNTALHHSCMSGNAEVANFLLEHGASPLHKNNNKETPYHLAAKEGFVSVLKIILKNKIFDPESQRRQMMADRDNEGNTCLHLAAQNGHTQVVQLCLQELADINAHNSFFATPLHLAAVNGHEEVVKMLAAGGAKLNSPDFERMTPLHRATKFNRLGIVNFLLSQGENTKVDAHDANGKTPLLVAASHGHVSIMTALHRFHAAIQARDACDRTCLHLAVINHEIKAVETSLKLGGKDILNSVDRDESTALHLAARKGFFKICQLLGEHHCDMTARDEHERIPLHWSASEGKYRTTKFLVESTPTNVNDIDDQGRTPLHLAAINGHQRLCELLMDLGADVSARDNRRWTPLCHASSEGHCNTMESLLEHGSPVNIKDHRGNTPLHLACMAGHSKAVRTLLDHNAVLVQKNSDGMTCFDVAIDGGHEDVAEVIIRDSRWHEVMRRNLNETPPMVRLIEKMPNIADIVLDQCLWITPGKTPVDDCVTYDFQYIYEPPLSKKEQPEDYIESKPVDLMVTEKTENLLSHRLTQALMKYKWRTFGKWVFLTNLLVYIIFISFLTVYVANNKTKHQQDALTLQDTAFATERDAKYVAYSSVQCSISDSRTANFHYLIRNSIVNANYPCRALKFEYECESPVAAIDNTLFASSANYTCPPTEWSPNQTNYIIGCVGPAYYATGDFITVYERRGRLVEVCTDLRYNSSCTLASGEWGIIFSQDVSIQTTACSSPFVVPAPPPSSYISQTVLSVFALVQMLKELIIIVLKRRAYLNDIGDSVLEWSLYILTLCFVWPGRLGLQPTDWQWKCGAVAVFLAWFDLVLFIQRFSFLGIYVVMFKSVLQTLLEVSIVFLMFGVAFGLSFYILFQGQDSFKSISWSLLQTFAMMLGEVEYVNIFVSGLSDVPYVGVSVFIYILFILIMPILLMNLLVGLAVGDIETVKQSAFLKRLEMQVEMISSVERWMPYVVQKYFYKTSLQRYPRRPKNIYCKVKEQMDLLTSMGGAEESFGSAQDKEKEQRLVQISTELTRQKTRMRGVQKQLDMQSRMLRTIAEQMKIKSEVYESDNDDDMQLDELYS